MVSAGRIFIAIGLGSFYLIFAAILEPETYGELSYLIAIAGTSSVISRLGFPMSVVVYRAKENHTMSNQLNVFCIISTGIASLILISVDVYVSLLCFTSSLFILNMHNFLGLKKYKKYFWFSAIRGILAVSLPVGMYFILDLSGILLGLIISNFIISIPLFKSLSFKVKSFQDLRANYKVLIHNYGRDLSLSLTNWVDKLVIVPLFGFFVVGLYQFNLQILLVISILPSSVYSFLLSERSSNQKHYKLNYLTLLISVIVVVIVILFSPFVVENIFPKYVEGIPALQIIVLSLIPLSITAILSAELQSKESTTVGYSAIVKIVSLLGLIAFLGTIYGLIGLSIAVVISTTLEAIFLFYLNYKIKNKRDFIVD